MTEKTWEQIKDNGDAYMHGWKKGYHNATLAERARIIKLLENRKQAFRKPPAFNYLTELDKIIAEIKGAEN